MRLAETITHLNRTPLFLLLVCLAGLSGLKDYAALIIPERLAVTIIGALFIFAVIAVKWKDRRIREFITKPQEARLFSPFFLSGAESIDKQWPRREEVDALVTVIRASRERHVSLVGETGVGKTTLIFQMTSCDTENIYVRIADYSEISRALVDAIFDAAPLARKTALISEKARLVSNILDASTGTRISSQRAFDRGYSDSALDQVAEAILDFFDSCVKSDEQESPTVTLVFDQYERHMQLLRDIPGSSGPRVELVDWYLFRIIVEGLRTRPAFRTLFAVRSDWLLQSVISTYPGSAISAPTSPDFSKYWTLRICHGVNAYSSVDAYAAVRGSLSQLRLAASDLDRFEHATGLKSEQFSNTFLVQLSGYLIEHYWDVDKLRLRRLLNEDADRIEPVRLLFDYIENDFLCQGHSDSRYELLKAVLFTVAIENRSTGTIATLDRIAALSHLAENEVVPQLDYLCSWGVVLKERLSTGDAGFRVGHDLIGDYVIDHERLSAGSRFKDAIQSLSYMRARTSFMTSIRSFPSLIGDIGKDPNVGQILILLYTGFGLLKIVAPATCNAITLAASSVLGEGYNSACMDTLPSFHAIFVMDCVWLNYIYTLTRGYLKLTLRNPVARMIAVSLPGLGAALAIVFSQTLQFALVPIFIVGLLLGIVLILGKIDGDYLGSVGDENFRWGYRTIFNMLFAACLMLFTPVFINPGPATIEVFNAIIAKSYEIFGVVPGGSAELLSATSWSFFGGAIMTYFCWHISAEQQGRLSIASRLALYDRARADHNKPK